MAKQGIHPIEQHAEKIVLGISVLLFVFVVFSYVISTPITVKVGSQTISPYDLDRQLGDIAGNVAMLYKSASFTPPPPTGGTEKALEELRKGLGVLDAMPTTMISPVMPWPEIQKVDTGSGSVEGPHGIASVGAPTIDEVYTGVTNAVLVPQPLDALASPTAVSSLSPPSRTATTPGSSGQDVTWAFLKMDFDMQQQYEIFSQNGYSREQANIILFMNVQVQRQRVYPNGTTGSWEDVAPYKTVTLQSAPTTISIDPDGSLSRQDDQKINQLFTALSSVQTALLYPLPEVAGGDPFPPYLVDGVLKPIATEGMPVPKPNVAPPPKPAPRAAPSPRSSSSGSRGGGSRGGGASRGPSGGGERGGRGPGPGPSQGPNPSHTLDSAALQAMNKAEMAFKQKRYTEAMKLLEQARVGAGSQPRFVKLEADVKAAYDEWQLREHGRQQQAIDESARNAEIWAIDFQAQPGKTYRYRSRVVLFNIFTHPVVDRGELKNPKDGSQVAITGEWSSPSQPITIASPIRFFLTGAGGTGDTANIEVFRFLQGQWYNNTVHSGLGELIGDIKPKDAKTNRPEMDFRTGFTVVDIGLDARAVVETDLTGEAVKVRPSSSAVLVYMDDDGTIQHRWSARDSKCQLRKELEYRAKLAANLPAGPGISPKTTTAPAAPGGRAPSGPTASVPPTR